MVELDIGSFGGDKTPLALLFVNVTFLHQYIQSPAYGDTAYVEMVAHFLFGRNLTTFSEFARFNEGSVVIDDVLIARQCLHVDPLPSVCKSKQHDQVKTHHVVITS